MLNCRERALALLALLLFYPAFICAQNPPAATFFLRETETQFSVNIANDSSDVFIYFTSPAYSWVGFGFGDSMKDSLMIILYPNAKNDNVTISPRIGNRNAEPTYSPDIKIEALAGTNITDDMFVLRAICRNCKVWPNGFIDEENKARPMIYAFGHGTRLQSDSPSADLRRHIKYGHFTMDLVSATGQGGVPAKSNAESGVNVAQGMTRDHDRASLAHALMGCVALFVLWPLNVIAAGFFRNIKIHVGVSVFIVIFLVVSYGLGIYTSYEYNRSKAFNTPHQIFAFLTLAPILLMSTLPIRLLASLHSLIPRLHTPLTSLTFFLLVLTGGLGFILSFQARPIILGYSAIAIAVFFFNILLQTCIKRRGSAYARASTRARLGEEDDRDLMLARYFAGRKVKEEHSQSNHSRSTSSTSQGGYYGGGTMPGPQYLMNMHPGVPVHRWSVVEGGAENRETRPGWKRL